MKKDKIYKNVKLYNIIMSNFWLLITTILLGLVIGYFLDKNSKKEDSHYMLFLIIIFFVIGIINFFIRILKEVANLNTEQKAKIDIPDSLESDDLNDV